MFKKNILKKAADKLAEAKQTAETTAENQPVPAPPAGQRTEASFFARAWRRIKLAARAVFIDAPRAVWLWICSLNIIALANCALLLLIITLFSILISQITGGKNDRATKDAPAPEQFVDIKARPKNAAAKPAPVVIDVPAKVRVSAVEDTLTISLPLKKIVRPAIESGNIAGAPAQKPAAAPAKSKKAKKPLVAEVWTHGDTIVDGGQSGAKISQNSNFHGNLFLQNMRYYTLPCGLKIDGDLYLRNVGLLKFCGEFTVTGNIYVSRNSSFGPLPRTARLGGQVIF